MRSIYLLCLFIFAFTTAQPPRGVYIIIHGTWASESSWGKTGGDFFEALEHEAASYTCSTVPFMWSGNLDNQSRAQAGKELASLIQSYPSTMPIFLVGHSHGVNVGILACQELAARPDNHHTIQALFALAPPVSMSMYAPPMQVIMHLYNFFSCNDFVQPVLGIFDRVYPEHPRIANIRVLINGREPDHSQLRCPDLGMWLPLLHHHCCFTPTFFETMKEGLLRIDDHMLPRYQQDYERAKVLSRDRWIINKMAVVFRKKHPTSSDDK